MMANAADGSLGVHLSLATNNELVCSTQVLCIISKSFSCRLVGLAQSKTCLSTTCSSRQQASDHAAVHAEKFLRIVYPCKHATVTGIDQMSECQSELACMEW